MRPRQTITEFFSTFLQFDADRVGGWATDPKLRRSMLNCQDRLPQPETSKDFWVFYWYKLWQTQPYSLAEAHLSAYLQEVCFWAAQKTIASFSTAQYTLSDCFQMAIVRVNKVLKGFNPQTGFSLSNYASVVFRSVLKDILRQQQEVDICTNWSLLRKLSQKRLVESLQHAGLSAETVACYLLAWNCFKTIYVPLQATGTRQLPKPDSATWKAIVKLYNAERYRQLSPPGPECSLEMCEKWMIICAKAARAYLYPTFTSINTPKPGQASGELLDDLPELTHTSLLNQLIEQEEQQNKDLQQSHLYTLLAAALTKLAPEAQRILQMYYGQELTQQQIAEQLAVKQYTVSRRLTKSRESLLLALAGWSNEALHISLTSEVLNNISTVLEEWLKVYYNHPPAHRESPL
ncbi:MAG: sigma-70 family RNA polymerase sigma factor [Chroococcidiopsidaceae cyanobacterium CP_BM_ER_R8_30]|nr:sigma-70 family RNA polymerase sigma factor [Chroococcidiopsidaceae cyanobacterium CP_BM_ER_R8_30]